MPLTAAELTMSSSGKLCVLSGISVLHLVLLVPVSESVELSESFKDSSQWRYVWLGSVGVAVMLLLVVVLCLDRKQRRISSDNPDHNTRQVRTVSIGMQESDTSITPVNHINNSAQSVDVKRDGRTRRTSSNRMSTERKPSVVMELS